MPGPGWKGAVKRVTPRPRPRLFSPMTRVPAFTGMSGIGRQTSPTGRRARASVTPSPGRPTRCGSRTGRTGLPRERRAASLRRAGAGGTSSLVWSPNGLLLSGMKPLNSRTTAAMAKVRQSRTKPEECVAQALRNLRIAYRRNVKSLPGRPDFANQSRGWAVQVHGCFWHQHACKRGTMPVHNREAWQAKFDRNKERDAEVETLLAERGLQVVVVWECETRDPTALKARLESHLR